MKNLWERLKPEYKQIIKGHQENYDYSPQALEVLLKNEVSFTHLPFAVVYDLFTWTDVSFTELSWRDYFGDRFFEDETKVNAE
jgi:hypothetical protein